MGRVVVVFVGDVVLLDLAGRSHLDPVLPVEGSRVRPRVLRPLSQRQVVHSFMVPSLAQYVWVNSVLIQP